MEEVGHAAAVDAPDAAVDEAVEVLHDQALHQHEFEAVGGHALQRGRRGGAGCGARMARP